MTLSQWAGKGLEMVGGQSDKSSFVAALSSLPALPTQYSDALLCESSQTLEFYPMLRCYLLFVLFGILNIFVPIRPNQLELPPRISPDNALLNCSHCAKI